MPRVFGGGRRSGHGRCEQFLNLLLTHFSGRIHPYAPPLEDKPKFLLYRRFPKPCHKRGLTRTVPAKASNSAARSSRCFLVRYSRRRRYTFENERHRPATADAIRPAKRRRRLRRT